MNITVIIRMTVVTEFNSMIYTIVISIHLTVSPTLYVHAQPSADRTSDPPSIVTVTNSSDLGSSNPGSSRVRRSADHHPPTPHPGHDRPTGTKGEEGKKTVTRFTFGKYSRYLKKKYDYRKDPPPHKWTRDPTRETINFWPGDGPNPFSFEMCKFDTQEKVENYKREMERIRNRGSFENIVGPVPKRYPNGSRIKHKRKYSWMGDDNVSEEAQFHRKIYRKIEEKILSNESVSSDWSATMPPDDITKRMRVRTRAKYKGWTYCTTYPNVSWSPDVFVNSPPSDLFYSDEFDPAGPETVEEYYGMSVEKPDYNDSIYHLPESLSRVPDTSKYREIVNRPLPREIDLWNTIKSHYDSWEQYNDDPIVTKEKHRSTTEKPTTPIKSKTFMKYLLD
uniref:Uncharacterized protein n=1 Tax=Cacopsylla melanoneura TaxID=428564 RepID=A0A8D8YGB5_9HEMI